MAAYAHYYPPYQGQPPELLAQPSSIFGYDQYDSRRSKTPTSLINHTGLSPGPLSTPTSRNNSQPPENFADQGLWDDNVPSSSTSPTSVRTPDNDTFECDMLDSQSIRDFYQEQNGADMSARLSQPAVVTMAPTDYLNSEEVFTDEHLHDVLATTMASAPQQSYSSFHAHAHPNHNMLAAQSYNNSYSQNYTTQPSRHDPWTGQGPPRYSDVPRSGHALFDPVTDHLFNYNPVDLDVWRMNNTDPNELASPNEAVPHHDGFFPVPPQNFTHNIGATPSQIQANRAPLSLRLAVPGGAFVDSNNYHPQTSFGDSRIYQRPTLTLTESLVPSPSPVTATGHSATRSPYQPSAPSPGSSDDMSSSYQLSDSGLVLDSHQHETSGQSLYPPSPVQFQPSPTMTISEVTFDVSPSPEPQHRVEPIRTARSKGLKVSGRPGGRALGTHLEPRVAKAAHDMRKIVACWHCVLQRDKCGPGDTCDRCLKRSQRPNADCGLGCSRIKLIELSSSFLPSLVTQIHEDSHLTHFVNQHIQQWGNAEITVYLTCGQDAMPRIPVKVYEFVPRGNELLVQIQYHTDPDTHERVAVKKQSPALGMVHINQHEEKKYDKHISDIVDNYLDAFGELCWREDDNDFPQKLFKLMTRVKPKSDDEAKLLREVFRLIVVTFIMGHTLTIAEETKHTTLSKMHSYQGMNMYAKSFISPRMANRQLKYFFCRLHQSIMATVLNKLQQILKSSKGCDKWLAAFVAVIAMCMAHEEQQKTVHVVMQTRAVTEGLDPRDAQAQADIACREIDTRMHFIIQIFRWKYNRKCNPLRDADHEWDKEVGFGDASSVSFVRQVAQLVKDNIDYLQQRRTVSISPANQTKYSSRLMGEFLLSFWLPQ